MVPDNVSFSLDLILLGGTALTAVASYAVLSWRVGKLEKEIERKSVSIQSNIEHHNALEKRVTELFGTIQAILARIETKVENLEAHAHWGRPSN